MKWKEKVTHLNVMEDIQSEKVLILKLMKNFIWL